MIVSYLIFIFERYRIHIIMLMKENMFSSFGKYVFRTPLYPITCRNDFDIYQNKDCFNEAIMLASPELYQEKVKSLMENTNRSKLRGTMEKYFSRSFYRCTPFGLFAGCSVGEFGEEFEISLSCRNHYERCTRLDMNYVCALIQSLESDRLIRSKLLYYPNDSIYIIGGQLRYTEYFYKGTKRIHQLINVELSDHIQLVLVNAKDGIKIDDLAGLLVSPDITREEAVEFINDLIDAQLLVSQLQPKVTGDNPLSVLISNLTAAGEAEICAILEKIHTLLKVIDSKPIGTTVHDYEDIIKLAEKTKVPFEPKFLFQTDMIKPATKAILPVNIVYEINDIIDFMGLFAYGRNNYNLSRFAEAYLERFENREMPLFHILDNELGLGYPVEKENSGDVNMLIDDLLLGARGYMANPSSIAFSRLDNIMYKKYIEALRSGINFISLTREDFQNTKTDLSALPNTLSVMCNILKNDRDTPCIVVRSIGGSSAANLLGRFCHLDTAIIDLVNSITEKEKEFNPDAIIAEIAHLPESRIGNIAHRPIIRDFEIHYLTQAGVEKEFRIGIEDLMISIKNGRIVLRSKKFDKEVLPRLTNAHNFGLNAMPVYQFLAEMQFQDNPISLMFNWGEVFNSFEYLPEVRYKEHIISFEQWRIPGSEIKNFDSKDDLSLMVAIRALQEKHKISDHIVIPDGDNELFVDLSNINNVRTMLSIVKTRQIIILKKALSQEDMFVYSAEGVFNSEFIIPLYKTQQQ